MNERTLAAERGLANAMVARMAAEGTRFIAHALSRDPNLRTAAIPFARTADAALRKDAPQPEPAPRHDDQVEAA
jgi:hypothetical protein